MDEVLLELHDVLHGHTRLVRKDIFDLTEVIRDTFLGTQVVLKGLYIVHVDILCDVGLDRLDDFDRDEGHCSGGLTSRITMVLAGRIRGEQVKKETGKAR